MGYLYILKVGNTFETTKEKYGDFEDWIGRFYKTSHIKIKTIDILKGERFPSFLSAKGFIITGSHSMVSDEEPWSVKLEKYIQKIAKTNIPLLGICYGHQLIAKALGGKSDFNLKGKEIGVVTISKTSKGYKDPLFKNFPKQFFAYETHYQSVLKMPKGAMVLAKNGSDNHQAIRYNKNIWGVQFHPEFDKKIMKEYIINQKVDLKKLNIPIDTLLNSLRDCDKSSQILTNFEKILRKKCCF